MREVVISIVQVNLLKKLVAHGTSLGDLNSRKKSAQKSLVNMVPRVFILLEIVLLSYILFFGMK